MIVYYSPVKLHWREIVVAPVEVSYPAIHDSVRELPAKYGPAGTTVKFIAGGEGHLMTTIINIITATQL